MGNAGATRLTMEHALQTQAYEVLETPLDLLERALQMGSAYDGQIALVMIALRFEREGKAAVERSGQIEKSITSFLQSLRPLVRKTDAVFLLNHTLHFFLFGANAQGGKTVQERLWDTVLWRLHNNSEGEVLHPSSIAAGHSAYPLPCASIAECIEAAKKEQLHFDLSGEKSTRKTVRSRTTQRQNQGQEAIAEEELHTLARKLGIPYLSLLPRKIPERLQQLVNPRLAQELRCYPLGRERNMLTVAMVNPQDRSVLDRLQQETGLCIFPVLTNSSELQTALEQLV
jgi:Type II secretion system (T2SS), protein E, N-terminal domain